MVNKILAATLLIGASYCQFMNGSDCEKPDECTSGCCANQACDEMKVCDEIFNKITGESSGFPDFSDVVREYKNSLLMDGSDCENADDCDSGCCANGACDEMKVCDEIFNQINNQMGDDSSSFPGFGDDSTNFDGFNLISQ